MAIGTQYKWETVKLETLAEFKNGINFTKDNFGEGMKVIGVSDFKDHVVATFDNLDEINPEGLVKESNLLKDGDTIFVRSNGNRQLIGRSLYINKLREDITHSAFTIRARINDSNAFPRYYAYLFRSDLIRRTLTAYGGGTNISNLNQTILKDLIVPLPPINEQKKITSILSAYDDLIENNLKRIKILEEMAQMIYREWFVNFRFPNHESVKMVDSPLGKIPEGWELKNLGDVCDAVMGQSPKSEFYNTEGNGLPFHQGVKDYGTRFPTHITYCTVESRIAELGDILISVRAPVGRINIANTKLIIGRGLSALRHKGGLQSFLLYQLKEIFRDEDSMGSGTIYKAITKTDLLGLKMICPSSDLDKQFNELVTPMDAEIENLTIKVTNLRKTRDLLLPKLISGELDVENLDIRVPEENGNA